MKLIQLLPGSTLLPFTFPGCWGEKRRQAGKTGRQEKREGAEICKVIIR